MEYFLYIISNCSKFFERYTVWLSITREEKFFTIFIFFLNYSLASFLLPKSKDSLAVGAQFDGE